MDNLQLNIAIVESSQIVFEGLSNILLKSGNHYQVYKIDDLDELPFAIGEYEINLIIMNPMQVVNRIKNFKNIKKNNRVHWLALVYSIFDNETLANFEGIIRVSDSPDDIVNMILNVSGISEQYGGLMLQESLSDRETEVLIQLVSGLSNKEIADKLFISIHTVISHRKSISQKTGIKSQSGLTIYALSNKIISLENIS